MPVISMFYGMIVQMFYLDNQKHTTPHIHVNYAEYDVVLSIPEGEVLAGEMPSKKLTLISAWIEIHQEDLMADWRLAIDGNPPFKIKPLT